MGRDPLDLFNSTPTTDYPGKTAPKNRGKSSTSFANHEWLKDLEYDEYLVGGVAKRFYRIGALSRAVMRQPVTIRSWESKGWLPPASFRTPPPNGDQIPGKATKGRRLYTEAQVVFLVESVIEYNINDPKLADWVGFRSHIAKNYPTH